MGVFAARGPHPVRIEPELDQGFFWRGVLRHGIGTQAHLHGAWPQLLQNRVGDGSQFANGQQALARLIFDLGQLLQQRLVASRGQVMVES